KMSEYHDLIIELLNSSKTSYECKKILLKEFSWIANDSYREIYEELEKNTELVDEAKYALDKLRF
ncbi:MAG: hypothetical protein ACP5D9_12205, partial [Mariniphaga sp.]